MDGTAHLDRTIDALAAAGVDLLLVGREANAAYVSGANRLALAGTRPFAPGCAVVTATRAIQLLSITDDGIPPEIPTERLFPITWNPATMLAAVARAVGDTRVHRLAIDELTPMWTRLLAAAFPDAALVDGEALLREVRRRKDDDDRRALGVAGAAANTAARTAIAAPDPVGAALAAIGRYGTARPSFTPVVRRAAARTSVRIGVVHDGWEGVVARTADPDDPAATLLASALAACTAGTMVGTLRSATVSVEGVGMGHEELADDAVLEPGMTVAVVVADADGIEAGETIAITTGAPTVLSRATLGRLTASEERAEP